MTIIKKMTSLALVAVLALSGKAFNSFRINFSCFSFAW